MKMRYFIFILKNLQEPIVVAYYDVDYVKNVKGTNYWRNRILKVAKDNTGYNFAVSNKNDFQHELSEFGLDFIAGDKPAVTARAGGLKYNTLPSSSKVSSLARSRPTSILKPSPITQESYEEEQLSHLQKIIDMMKRIRFNSGHENKHFQKGVMVATKSIMALYHEFKEEG